MERHQELWHQCLQTISGNVSPHVFSVWFRDISFERYDPEEKTVLIVLPHRYVYEYLEEVQAPVMRQALDAFFGKDVRLNYRIANVNGNTNPNITFPAPPQIPRFTIPDARERLQKGLRYYFGDRARWLPCYDQVAAWLSDNKGRGLLCVGTSGLGKTRICCDILPQILGRDKVVSVTAMEMGQRIDELLRARCVVIDDLGHEAVRETVSWKQRVPFYELCNAAERNGILLIVTTNLATTPKPHGWNGPWPYPTSIYERYGADVISRLRATTTVVSFEGDDLRTESAATGGA